MEVKNQDPANSTPPENGKVDDNSKGNQGDENIKALQKKLTEKDLTHKQLEKELAELKKGQEEKGKEKQTEVQKLQEGYEKIAKQLADMKMASEFKEVKKDFPKYSESIIKLLIKDKKGNLEEVREALKTQSKLLGIKSITTPKFEKKKAEELIAAIKKDTSLSPELKSLKIVEIKKNIK